MLNRILLWVAFIAYLVLLAVIVANHEMWGDEFHSWNIAKASNSFSDLIQNTRFEGHPPVWYSILWIVSKFTHHLSAVQAVHSVIAALSVMLILFFSPLPLRVKLLIPFGYFFLFEYAALSRNYGIGILLACCLCVVMRKSFRYKMPVYYLLLFLLSNTHLLVTILAGCLHLYFMMFTVENSKSRRSLWLHILCGAIVFLPALYFIFPPSDSQLNVQYWVNRWNFDQLKAVGQAPLRSFVPVPAWWNYNSWNTQFLLDSLHKSKFVNLVIALIPIGFAIFVLYRNRKSLTVFVANLLLSFAIALVVFPLTSGRYAGFLFIGFIFSFWLFCYEAVPRKIEVVMVTILLVVQVIAAVLLVSKDIKQPFSNAYRVNELLRAPSTGTRIVTDYWAMNAISAFADRPIYCIDIQRELSFVQWGPELGRIFERQYRYYDGFSHLFAAEKIGEAYMISTASPKVLQGVDGKLFQAFNVMLADKREGAIEKGGNLYLYLVRKK